MSHARELATYMAEVSRYPVLPRLEEMKLAEKAAAGDAEAREKLIVSNLRFVVQVANQFKAYASSGKYSILDLVQEGNSGLVHAASKFDPERGYRFITYAVWWIRARIMSFIIRSHSMVKLGTTESERKLFFKMSHIRRLLEIKDAKERDKTRKILAKQLKTSPTLIQRMEERIFWNDVSLEKQLQRTSPDTANQACLKDFLRDETDYEQEAEERNLLSETRTDIELVMEKLSDREREIIERRYLSEQGETLQSIASTYGLSRERIRQLEANAFSKMKGPLSKSEAVKECLEWMKSQKN